MSDSNVSLTDEIAYDELTRLVSFGCRFHGTKGNHDAADWICAELLERTGLQAELQTVDLPAWDPGTRHGIDLVAPVQQHIEAWPMLWSGATDGTVHASVEYLGPCGLWGDSMVWKRFVALDADGEPVGYVLSRDAGPAAPQPLPAGYDATLPHLSISHEDGERLLEWIRQGIVPEISFACDCSDGGNAISDNIIVDIPGTDGIAVNGTAVDNTAAPCVVLCAHYDTYYNTRGAYDNGSGTIALLELAQALASHPRPYRVRIIFFTAEEWHLGGSRHYVEHASDLKNIHFVYNIDGLGRADFVELFSAPEDLAYRFDSEVKAYNRDSGRDMDVITRFPPMKGTDDASFHMAGVPTLYMTINDRERLHQPNDLPEMRSAGNIVWAVNMVSTILDRIPRETHMEKPVL
ncbi:MAG: M20/M25/M40 family metallo-hydrolase [Bifidobacterium sp.]|uniref:M20/M25/M40 family metallo-hydrolase n=1 Tax=Bifidobacterium sp. TaxID=41200 RepID=UPI0039EAF620